MSNPHVVTLIGGYTDMVSNFENRLAEWGIEVCAHCEYLPARVPAKTTLVIVLKTACSHSLMGAAQMVATKRKIPLVVVDHQWKSAEVTLKQNGILDHAPNPVIEPGSEFWAEARITELAHEVTRLRQSLTGAEDLILEQQGLTEGLQRLTEGLQKLVESQQVHITGLQKARSQEAQDEAWQKVPLATLRRYASKELGIAGASKIRGGKDALLEQVKLKLVK